MKKTFYTLSLGIGAQTLGDLFNLFELPRSYWTGSKQDGALDTDPIRRFLTRAERLLPDDQVWLLVILEPLIEIGQEEVIEPKHFDSFWEA